MSGKFTGPLPWYLRVNSRPDGKLLVVRPIDPIFLVIPKLQVVRHVCREPTARSFGTMLTLCLGMMVPLAYSGPCMIYSMRLLRKFLEEGMRVLWYAAYDYNTVEPPSHEIQTLRPSSRCTATLDTGWSNTRKQR